MRAPPRGRGLDRKCWLPLLLHTSGEYAALVSGSLALRNTAARSLTLLFASTPPNRRLVRSYRSRNISAFSSGPRPQPQPPHPPTPSHLSLLALLQLGCPPTLSPTRPVNQSFIPLSFPSPHFHVSIFFPSLPFTCRSLLFFLHPPFLPAPCLP